jgi:hypothetical protein
MTRTLLALWLTSLISGCGDPAAQPPAPPSDGFRDPPWEPPSDACDDGLDNDVDGSVDEGCYCEETEVQECFPAAAEKLDVGQCAAGRQACVGAHGDFALGRWGACVGAILPTPEICGNAIDEDCDGYVSPCQDGDITGTPCDAGDSARCYLGPAGTEDVGICEGGMRWCGEFDVWGPCEGQITPAQEVCGNAEDEDCDGVDASCDGSVD